MNAAPNADGWQTFAFEWEASTVRWYLNGVQYGSMNSRDVDPSGWYVMALFVCGFINLLPF